VIEETKVGCLQERRAAFGACCAEERNQVMKKLLIATALLSSLLSAVSFAETLDETVKKTEEIYNRYNKLQSKPAQAAEPSLLDTFHFIIGRHEVGEQPPSYTNSTETVIEHTEDRLVTYTTQAYGGEPYRTTWQVVDKDTCVFQVSNEFSNKGLPASIRYFFNNLLPDRVPVGRTNGDPASWLTLVYLADNSKAGRCEYNYRGDGKEYCYDRLVISGFMPEESRLQTRILKAMDYLYANFCRYAKPEKPY
jgi:hypothetical protein